MSSTQIQREEFLQFDKNLFNEQVNKLCEPALGEFKRIVRSHFIFHSIFIFLSSIELICFFFFFHFFIDSSFLAVALASLFLTGFSYFVLRLYFQSKKPEQLAELQLRYLTACQRLIQYQETIPEHPMAIASASTRLAGQLDEMDLSFCHFAPRWELAEALINKAARWWQWVDVHRMQEMLLLAAIEEHIKVVRLEPTNLEVHARLANAYVTLSTLYSDPRQGDSQDNEQWVPFQRLSKTIIAKFRATAEKAIEQFKILNDYAPDDPWIHAQLAYSYRDLNMPVEETQEYEKILRLVPDDRETLYRLGVLYFQQGRNAEGLRIYDQLRRAGHKKADDLIRLFGGNRLQPVVS